MSRKARILVPSQVKPGKQRTSNQLIATQGRSLGGLEEWLRQFGIEHTHAATEHVGTIDMRVPDAQREQFALALLARALALIDKRSNYRPISWLGMPDSDPLFQFSYLISCYERRRSKSKKHKKQQPARKPGRPRKYNKNSDETLLAFIRNGRADLQEKGVTKISDAEALAEGMRALWRERGFSEREVRQFVEAHRRRISEAKKRSRVAPKTRGNSRL